jgi:hypothetical protein
MTSCSRNILIGGKTACRMPFKRGGRREEEEIFVNAIARSIKGRRISGGRGDGVGCVPSLKSFTQHHLGWNELYRQSKPGASKMLRWLFWEVVLLRGGSILSFPLLPQFIFPEYPRSEKISTFWYVNTLLWSWGFGYGGPSNNKASTSVRASVNETPAAMARNPHAGTELSNPLPEWVERRRYLLLQKGVWPSCETLLRRHIRVFLTLERSL